MSKTICIMGESGSGKTTSLRNLDPAETYIIDADKKGLNWKGWKKQYNTEAKNYAVTNKAEKILSLLKCLNDKAPHIKTIVVDTINGIMIEHEMRLIGELGFSKWSELAYSVWAILDYSLTLRDDLTVIFMAHTQVEYNDNGYSFTRIKTNGRKLEKIVLESKFTTVMLAKAIDGRFIFETKANNSTAKTPMGAFSETEIDNDMSVILKKLEEF
ncbi:ATP-binding protein [Clostridia bacterium]|nr:ATP-binding protein [Clostridia bacterium]